MNTTEEEQREQVAAARAVLDDPNSTQLDRDLAHIQLKQHEQAASGDNFAVSGSGATNENPQEWLMLEFLEAGVSNIAVNQDLVAMVEDVLLRRKVKAVNQVVNPDGTKDVLTAYPKLKFATESGLRSGDKEKRASANAVIGCLLQLALRDAESIPYFFAALKLRPCDWRLYDSIGESYKELKRTSKSLDAYKQASELTEEGSLERLNVTMSRGKILFDFGRKQEAKECFLGVLGAAEQCKDKLDEENQAALVVVEFMLCTVFARDRNVHRCKEHWDSAEAKHKALSPEIRKRKDWGCRMSAQRAMGALDTSLLIYQECNNCRELCEDPKHCAKCKVAVYCSRDCQVAAWKAGHKRECKEAKENRKKDQKVKKMRDAKLEYVNRTPLDSDLDAFALWIRAENLSSQPGMAEEAAFFFCLALFLDFNLDCGDMQAARDAAAACSPEHPLAFALRMVIEIENSSSPAEFIRSNVCSALQHIKQLSSYPKDAMVESIDQLDRIQFGMAMCYVFSSRSMMFIAAAVGSVGQTSMRESALDLLQHVGDYLCTSHWLTLMYELGMGGFSVVNWSEGRYWLEMFLNKLAGVQKSSHKTLSRHWEEKRQEAAAMLEHRNPGVHSVALPQHLHFCSPSSFDHGVPLN